MDLPVFIYIQSWYVSIEDLVFLHLKSFSSFTHKNLRVATDLLHFAVDRNNVFHRCMSATHLNKYYSKHYFKKLHLNTGHNRLLKYEDLVF